MPSKELIYVQLSGCKIAEASSLFIISNPYRQQHNVFEFPPQNIKILRIDRVQLCTVLIPQNMLDILIWVDLGDYLLHKLLVLLAPNNHIVVLGHFFDEVLHTKSLFEVEHPTRFSQRFKLNKISNVTFSVKSHFSSF